MPERTKDPKTGIFTSKAINGDAWNLLRMYAEIGASQSKLAELAGVSENTLKAKCKQAFGITLKQWQQSHLLASTESLLIGLRRGARRDHHRATELLLKNADFQAAVSDAMEEKRKTVTILYNAADWPTGLPDSLVPQGIKVIMPSNGREIEGVIRKDKEPDGDFQVLSAEDMAKLT